MKELNNFRGFLYEAKFKVGDRVTMGAGGEDMEITKARRMFGSNINAYTVKKADGEEVEYDESQLKLVEGKADNQLDKLFRLSIGANVNQGEDKLYKLTQAWEAWNVENDDKYDSLVDPLYMAVELVQDAGVPGVNDVEDDKEYRMYIKSADKHLKKFNKDAAAAAKKLNETPLNEMQVVDKKTGKDITRHVLDLLSGKIDKKKFEELTGLKKESVNEGIWSIGNPDDIQKFISILVELKNDYWNVVGSDTVADGLDMAIKGANELLGMKNQGE